MRDLKKNSKELWQISTHKTKKKKGRPINNKPYDTWDVWGESEHIRVGVVREATESDEQTFYPKQLPDKAVRDDKPDKREGSDVFVWRNSMSCKGDNQKEEKSQAIDHHQLY